MFEHISLRSQKEQAEADISSDLQMAGKAVKRRIMFATIVATCSLFWQPLWAAGAYVGAIALWELCGRPWLAKRAVPALQSRGSALWVVQRLVILFVSCLYASAPLTGVLSGEMIGWYVAMMTFCTAVLSGVTYFSNDRWQLAAFIGPSFLVACSAPFVFGSPPLIVAAVLMLNAVFTISALQAAAHRGQLVESISRQQAARTRAESANVEKSQFIANVSHELRSPLNAIIGYSEILREAAEEDARATDQDDLDKVLLASRRLLHLVNELLDISKIEAGKLSLNVSWFDAAEMIDSAVITTRSFAEASGKRVNAEVSDELGQGVSDEFRLSQCVANLVSGALLCAESDVTLRASRVSQNGGEWFDIEVLAAGAKLDAAAIERLFDPFAQADEANRGGASLGLAITRRVARLLGGDVSAECRPEGALFVLRTPVLARVAPVQAADTAKPAQAA